MGLGTLAWSFYSLFSIEKRRAHETELAHQQAERFRTQVVLYTKQRVPVGVALADLFQRQ